jgi:hypothetical protein
MKKIILFLVSIVAIIVLVSFFIPSAYQTSTTNSVNIAPDAAFRTFGNYKNPKWWPGTVTNDTIFVYKENIFKVKSYQLNNAHFSTVYKGITILYTVSFVQQGSNQMQLLKVIEFELSTNPFKKLIQRIQLPTAEKYMNELFQHTATFFSDAKYVYGLQITKQKVKDSALISVKDIFDHYPTTTDIYKQVAEIKKYIQTQQGKEVNYPFLNIRKTDSIHFESMVAIATEKELPGTNRFNVKKMVLGNILFAVATGGLSAIKEGEKQMEYYVFDYRKSSPAIPFQSLITDRSAEPDTTKWQTGLHYPIFR